MTVIVTRTESAHFHEADEWYSGELVRVESGDDYGYGPTVKFIIALDDEESETWAMASETLSPRSKLWGWVKAIDASKLPDVNGTLNLGELCPARVDVMFEHARRDDGTERERVVKIRASKTKAPTVKERQKATPRATAPDEEPF